MSSTNQEGAVGDKHESRTPYLKRQYGRIGKDTHLKVDSTNETAQEFQIARMRRSNSFKCET
jgi:hypothetical protein